MTGFSLLGALIFVGLIGVGVYWLLTNITIKSQNPYEYKYEYKKDENGNEYVKDNTDEKA